MVSRGRRGLKGGDEESLMGLLRLEIGCRRVERVWPGRWWEWFGCCGCWKSGIGTSEGSREEDIELDELEWSEGSQLESEGC